MIFVSTNKLSAPVNAPQAILQGLAGDGGLFVPSEIPVLDSSFFDRLGTLSLQEIAFEIALPYLQGHITKQELETLTADTFNFPAPLVEIEKGIFSLELFHGPTLAFKDFGARFMARAVRLFRKDSLQPLTILVATSGDTGSAVANGFLGVEGIRVVLLYPSGQVSDIQEKQFTTLGQNITAVEVRGTFDDCQRMVKESFADKDIKEKLELSSANSINIARLIPQMLYYFYAYSRLSAAGSRVIFSVPSGNFGNLTAGLYASKMGLPITKFVAATNANDIVPEYLLRGQFAPRPSIATISNAMDVGNPSNFARMLYLFHNSHQEMCNHVLPASFSDEETRAAMREVYARDKYVLDPHGAVAYLGLKKHLPAFENSIGIFLETAHPAKFLETVEETIGVRVDIPERLAEILGKEKKSIKIENKFLELKNLLFQL